MSVKTPTTWKRNGIVHEVTHVQGVVPWILDKALITFRTTCGMYEKVDDERAFVEGRSVGCIDCLNGVTVPYHLKGIAR